MAVTLHFQSTGSIPGQGGPARMIGPSLTVGRGSENDLCLPDPGKVISKTHCTIEDHGGNIVVVDLSTNGTFLNYSKQPLGPVPTPLNDGDILTMGAYELLVEIVGAAPRPDPVNLPPAEAPRPASAASQGYDDLMADTGADDGDFLDDLLSDGPLRGPGAVARPELGDDGLLPPLGEDEAGLLDPMPEPETQGASDSAHSAAVNDSFQARGPAMQPIPEDWGDDLLAPTGGDDDLLTPPGEDTTGDDSDPFAVPPAGPVFIPEDEPLNLAPDVPVEPVKAPAIPAPAPQTPAPAPVARPAPTPPTVAPAAASDAAARAFLDAAGAGDLNVSDAELVETMARLGGVMQTLIHGMREILMTRADIKSEFRIAQTRIGAGGNNPLKFSISPEQAIEAMVKPSSTGYLEAREAATQALDDIKAHEVAMMSAMEAALKGILAQLAPDELEKQMTTGGGLTSLLKGKKARYWDVYETMYARISDQAESDFHELFARSFARAYQAQLERLK